MSEIDGLEKGDRFEVGCHEKTLHVHSTRPFCGVIELDAYDGAGAHWPVAEVDGQLYLGWSQTTTADKQTRAKEIEAIDVVEQQTPLVQADGGCNDRSLHTDSSRSGDAR